jgi:hypothetical protein
VRPALPTVAAKIGFLLGTTVCLLLPVFLGRRANPDHLIAVPWKWAPAAHLYRESTAGRPDIDVLLLGSSLLEAGIDAPYLREALSRDLGRPAEVQELLAAGYSLLVPYELLKETLRHRKVSLAVIAHFADEPGPPTGHEAISHYLWDEAEDASIFAGEPLPVRASWYAFGVLGGPRRLLGAIRRDGRMGPSGIDLAVLDLRHAALGGELRRLGYSDSPGGAAPHLPFVELQPTPPSVPLATTFYRGPGTNPRFTEIGPPPPADLELLVAILRLARDHGTRVVLLNMAGIRTPTEQTDQVVHVVSLPQDLYRQGLSVIGVPNSTLFAGLSTEQLHGLYTDHRHFSINGARYYTRVIAPSLIDAFRGDHGK